MKLSFVDEYNINVTDINSELEKCYGFYREMLKSSLEPEFIKDIIVKNLIIFIVDYAVKCNIKYNKALPFVTLTVRESEVNSLGYIHNGDLLINIARVEVESHDKTEKKYRYIYGKIDK